jgi:hypothetical protein
MRKPWSFSLNFRARLHPEHGNLNIFGGCGDGNVDLSGWDQGYGPFCSFPSLDGPQVYGLPGEGISDYILFAGSIMEHDIEVRQEVCSTNLSCWQDLFAGEVQQGLMVRYNE